MPIVSGFYKRAYNGSYPNGYGPYGQNPYQNSPAQQPNLSKGVAAAGIGGAALYGAGKARLAGAPMRAQRRRFSAASKIYHAPTPGIFGRIHKGTSLDEIAENRVKARNTMNNSLAAMKRYRSQGPGRVKAKLRAFSRGVKNKTIRSGFANKALKALKGFRR